MQKRGNAPYTTATELPLEHFYCQKLLEIYFEKYKWDTGTHHPDDRITNLLRRKRSYNILDAIPSLLIGVGGRSWLFKLSGGC